MYGAVVSAPTEVTVGAAGAVVSTVRDSVGEALEVFPAVSVSV
jgi:hypothetical protein